MARNPPSVKAVLPLRAWSQVGHAAAFDGYKNLVSHPHPSLPLFQPVFPPSLTSVRPNAPCHASLRHRLNSSPCHIRPPIVDSPLGPFKIRLVAGILPCRIRLPSILLSGSFKICFVSSSAPRSAINPRSSQPLLYFRGGPYFGPPHIPNPSMAHLTPLAAYRADSANPARYPRLAQGPKNMGFGIGKSPYATLRR